jgi:PAS domain S-box-containing protein
MIEFLITLLSFFVGLAVWQRNHNRQLIKKYKTTSDENIMATVENERLGIYQKVIQNSPDLFIIVDQSLQVVVANRAAAKYGWTSSREFVTADIADTSKLHFEFEIQSVLRLGIVTDGEIRLVRNQSDEWRFFLYHIFPIHDESRTIVGATLTAVDVTAQREAENRLHQQTEFIEGVLNAIPDPIYVKDGEHRWIYGNQAFSKMMGKKLSEYKNKTDDDVLPHETAMIIKAYDSEAFQSSLPVEMEETLSFTNGHFFTSLSKRTHFQFQDGRKVLVAVLRDISERKKLESELQISKSRQHEAARLATLGETAGGIAHEINNPLNVIVGLAELMKVTVEKKGMIEKEKLFEYCDRLVKYSMRISKIIKGLRSISRDASQDPFADVNLQVLVDETLELCHQQFVNRSIELKVKNNPEPVVITGRYAQVSQIIMNLVNNARDAVEGLPNAQIFLETLIEDGLGIIRVWDSGPGISAEIESKLMRPFFTTKPAGKGTGLGLSISKAIASDHKGTLILNRKISNSCFELRIPLLQNSKKSTAA